MPDKLRILCANIQAGATTRRPLDYLLKGWNVWLPFGKVASLTEIATHATTHDIVGLQEADGGSLRSGFACQAGFIGALAHLPHAVRQVNRELGPIMASGNAIIGRFQPSQVSSFPLPSRIPGRGVLVAEYALENGQFLTVAVAHLSLSVTARRAQAKRLAQILSDAKNPILMGDFNCLAQAPEMQVLFEHTRLRPPSDCLLTYPSWGPRRAIDHIWIGGGLRRAQVEAVMIGGSDHLALSATVSLPSPILKSSA